MKKAFLLIMITVLLLAGCAAQPIAASNDAASHDSAPLATKTTISPTAAAATTPPAAEPAAEPAADYTSIDAETLSFFKITDETVINKPEKTSYCIIKRTGDAIEVGSEDEDRLISLFLGEDYVVFAESEDGVSYAANGGSKNELFGRGITMRGKLEYGYNNQHARSDGDISNIEALADEYKDFLRGAIPDEYLEKVLYPGKKDVTRLPYIRYMPAHDGLAIFSQYDPEGIVIRYTDVLRGADIILSKFEATDELVDIIPLNGALVLAEGNVVINHRNVEYEVIDAQLVYTAADEETYSPSWLIRYYLLYDAGAYPGTAHCLVDCETGEVTAE